MLHRARINGTRHLGPRLDYFANYSRQARAICPLSLKLLTRKPCSPRPSRLCHLWYGYEGIAAEHVTLQQ
jgi:hypothetical protein